MKTLPPELDRYFGSKDAIAVAERTIRLFPDHSVYVELFLGGGAILRRKRPALRSIGIDIDPEVVAAWRRYDYPGLEVIEGDAIAWIETHGQTLPADALVVADPPYVHSVRGRKRYKYELNDEDHLRMIDALDSLGCSVFLHGYQSSLYCNHPKLQNWRMEEIPTMSRGGRRIECVWNKSSIASFAIEPRHRGHNFRERERLKRKINRWKTKFENLHAGERAIILQALLEVDVTVTADALSHSPATMNHLMTKAVEAKGTQ